MQAAWTTSLPTTIYLQYYQGQVLSPVFGDLGVALLQSRTYSWFSMNFPLAKKQIHENPFPLITFEFKFQVLVSYF